MTSSLYIHIPFCLKKCIYCDFFSIPYDEALAMNYVTALVQELDLRRDAIGELKTVYIGGGTPTVIPTAALVGLLRTVKETFALSSGAEVTVEANPGTLTTENEKVQALSEAGITRFSIGVQSFYDNELKLLGRTHTFEDVLKSIAAVRYANVQNLSLDLMYGIPGQIPEGWLRNLLTVIEFLPQHISAYELTPEKGTPLYQMIAEEKLEKPPEDMIVEMYYLTIDRLAEAGYHHYEISNFAQKGYECRHNLTYWDRGEYVGIGAGAHSFLGDRRMRNVSDIRAYVDQVSGGRLPIEETTDISCEDAVKEFVFLGLRKTEGLNINQFREDLGIDILAAAENLVVEGLLESDGTFVRLTRKGLVVSNTVITEMFRALGL